MSDSSELGPDPARGRLLRPDAEPEPDDAEPEQPVAHRLLEKAQVDGVIRRMGEIVHVAPSQAAPHMEPLNQEDDMNDTQFEELKATIVSMLEPVRALAQQQLDTMKTPQQALSTKQLMGTDATRDAVTGDGAPIAPEADQGTMPPPDAPMGPAAEPMPEAEPPALADMGPQTNAPGTSLHAHDPIVTADGRIKGDDEPVKEPNTFGEG